MDSGNIVDYSVVVGSVLGTMRLVAECLLFLGDKLPGRTAIVLKVVAKVAAYFGAGKPKKL
jgi:hypothetical protein